MSDEEKIRIKNEIRYEIFRHRYFEDADWSMPQEVLSEYECVMNKIVVGEKIYDYLYIFRMYMIFRCLILFHILKKKTQKYIIKIIY